ncbi:MAG: glucokinase [Chloroflexota bacterium]|jgi:glucokinase|nr:glucokinase [Chloroflexota bacterium]
MAGQPAAAAVHLGLDLGATNIKSAVVERRGAHWQTLGTEQTPTHGEEGPAGVIERLAEAGRVAMAEHRGISSVGIGVPGLYYPERGATRFLVNLPGDWDMVPVAPYVGHALGSVPTYLVNDARAFGLAELRLGAGRGAKSMVGLTLGTGIGGVFAIDGHIVQGHDGTAGEMGHQTIDPDGPPCNCGNNGCLEVFTRAEALAEACGAASAEEAIERARGGDAAALAGLASVGRYLGIGIANMVTVITPDRVVIGGGIAAAGDLLLDPIRAEVGRRVHVTSLDQVTFAMAELGTWAGAIGAAIHGAEMAEAAA